MSGDSRAKVLPPPVGARGIFSRTITQSDITLYAGLTGDFAPHHVDAEFGRRTRFGGTIAHGLFTASLVDGALAALFPRGSLSARRELRFTSPVRPGDTITAIAEVAEVDAKGRTVTLTTTCTNQRGEAVVTGTATERIMASNPEVSADRP
ncbi:MAG TPA: MaoC family dehydratase [Candidatus Methylomirabilis sp.]|jgi:acyl dehydratase